MRLLVVEDDEFKMQHVKQLLRSEFFTLDVTYARSISSAMRALEADAEIGAVILDMSLPTFDVGPGESGGRPQGFGGVSVIQHLDALELSVPVIVLTQFLQFGEGDESLDVDGLEAMLTAEYSALVRSLVRYGAGSDQWKDDLVSAVRNVLES